MEERLNLASICGGAVQEKVDRALEKVAKNILDPNTEAKKKRTITLKITMEPDEDDREDVKVSSEVAYTLAPETGVQTQFFMYKDLQSGRVTVTEHRKGEIKGQLSFSDMGTILERKAQQEKVNQEMEAREYPDEEINQSVLDFRKHG